MNDDTHFDFLLYDTQEDLMPPRRLVYVVLLLVVAGVAAATMADPLAGAAFAGLSALLGLFALALVKWLPRRRA